MKTQWFLLLLFASLFSLCNLAMAAEKDLPLPEVLPTIQDEDVLKAMEQAVVENKADMVFSIIMELRERWKTNSAIGDMVLSEVDDKSKNEAYRLILMNELVTASGEMRMPEKMRLNAPGVISYKAKIVKMLAVRLEDTNDSSAIRGESARRSKCSG